MKHIYFSPPLVPPAPLPSKSACLDFPATRSFSYISLFFSLILVPFLSLPPRRPFLPQITVYLSICFITYFHSCPFSSFTFYFSSYFIPFPTSIMHRPLSVFQSSSLPSLLSLSLFTFLCPSFFRDGPVFKP